MCLPKPMFSGAVPEMVGFARDSDPVMIVALETSSLVLHQSIQYTQPWPLRSGEPARSCGPHRAFCRGPIRAARSRPSVRRSSDVVRVVGVLPLTSLRFAALLGDPGHQEHREIQQELTFENILRCTVTVAPRQRTPVGGVPWRTRRQHEM